MAREAERLRAEGLARAIPFLRLGQPGDYPGIVAYLASDEAAYFTGSVLVMDGGETAGSVVSGPGGPGHPDCRWTTDAP